MRGLLSLLVFASVSFGTAQAQPLQPGVRTLNNMVEANVRWGSCLLSKVGVGGNRYDLGDVTVDAAIRNCLPQMTGMLGGENPAFDARLQAEAKADTQSVREPAVQAIFNAYRAQHFKHAGGQPAVSTARSK